MPLGGRLYRLRRHDADLWEGKNNITREKGIIDLSTFEEEDFDARIGAEPVCKDTSRCSSCSPTLVLCFGVEGRVESGASTSDDNIIEPCNVIDLEALHYWHADILDS